MKTRRCLEIKRAPKKNEKETRMLEWYWKEVGGTLCAEFQVATATQRRLDAVILPEGEYKEVNTEEMRDLLKGKEAIVVQAKANRLGMPLMGQTLFSAALIKRKFNPRSIRAIALCKEDDPHLRSLFESPLIKAFIKGTSIKEVKVVEAPKYLQCRKWPSRRGKTERSMICRYWNQTKGKEKLSYDFPFTDDHSTNNPSHTQVFGALTQPDKKPHATIVHAEKGLVYIGMSLIGEALFSAILVKRKFKIRSVHSVALCEKNDTVLGQLLEDINKKARKMGINIEVGEILRRPKSN